jgi:anaerobic selenocysteine-containing dehydrogenase
VLREYRRRQGEAVDKTLGTNPGQVWEELEFWIALTWRIDPDGSRGIRKWYESKARPGEPVTSDEYYADIFEKSVPGLPEAAAREGITPLGYMKKYGAYDVPYAGQRRYETESADGVEVADGERRAGFKTPSGRLELYSPTMSEWGYDDQALPGYIPSQVNWRDIDFASGERALLPTFRLPTLIHTRSGNAKWLQEISHTNPLWVHPEDAAALELKNGKLARVSTRIGHFVVRVWVTEGIHPGVVACSHHVGRWRLFRDVGGEKLATSLVEVQRKDGSFLFRQKERVGPFHSADKDTEKVFWHEAGVNQNLTFPVQPDPVSGMHCWHQKVRVQAALPADRYGDIYVDTHRARAVYEEWMRQTRPAPGPGGLRRPLWLNRPLRPVDEAYRI